MNSKKASAFEAESARARQMAAVVLRGQYAVIADFRVDIAAKVFEFRPSPRGGHAAVFEPGHPGAHLSGQTLDLAIPSLGPGLERPWR